MFAQMFYFKSIIIYMSYSHNSPWSSHCFSSLEAEVSNLNEMVTQYHIH